MRFVLVANPGSRRVELFQSALAGLGHPLASVVPWADLLAGRAHLAEVVRAGDVVRIESPGRDFEVERLLLLAGAECEGALACREDVLGLEFDRGRILWPRQWYLGFCRALESIREQLAACPPHVAMNDPDEIAVMFDKGACHRRLDQAGVPVPRALGPVGSFEELQARMAAMCCRQVFVKLAHGSSASGAVAYRTDGRRHQALTTVEQVREGGEVRLYNSRRIRRHEDLGEIAALVDALIPHGVHVEEWIPKAGIQGRVFDLRVLAIAGRARHVAVRLSRSPMTNLHLLNERGDPAVVKERMGAEGWSAAMRTCEAAARAFPRSLHAGVDLLVAPGYRKHAVLEVNAFGDLLPGILEDGVDTYTAEITALAGTSGSVSGHEDTKARRHEGAANGGELGV